MSGIPSLKTSLTTSYSHNQFNVPLSIRVHSKRTQAYIFPLYRPASAAMWSCKTLVKVAALAILLTQLGSCECQPESGQSSKMLLKKQDLQRVCPRINFLFVTAQLTFTPSQHSLLKAGHKYNIPSNQLARK